ncbi:MAG: hypothetical protein OK454_09760 [Thaumarchaeota archaeon]|nr:hypothetical protein [Nitrososphaerota archaeon]
MEEKRERRERRVGRGPGGSVRYLENLEVEPAHGGVEQEYLVQWCSPIRYRNTQALLRVRPTILMNASPDALSDGAHGIR